MGPRPQPSSPPSKLVAAESPSSFLPVPLPRPLPRPLFPEPPDLVSGSDEGSETCDDMERGSLSLQGLGRKAWRKELRFISVFFTTALRNRQAHPPQLGVALGSFQARVQRKKGPGLFDTVHDMLTSQSQATRFSASSSHEVQ